MSLIDPAPEGGTDFLSSALRRPSHNRARSRSIWLWQLSLAAGVITISLVAAIIIPDIYSYVRSIKPSPAAGGIKLLNFD